MSCHDIGRGMNSVAQVVLDLYDACEVGKEPARKIIAACRNGVNWCDGNEGEATACMNGYRCGKCLRIFSKGEHFFSVLNVSDDVKNPYDIMDEKSFELATDELCEECFDEVIKSYCNDETAGRRERTYIMNNYREDYFTCSIE